MSSVDAGDESELPRRHFYLHVEASGAPSAQSRPEADGDGSAVTTDKPRRDGEAETAEQSGKS